MKVLDQNLLPGDIELLKQCKAAITDILPDAEIILYGSRARGDAHPDSDYDLLVLTDQETDVDL